MITGMISKKEACDAIVKLIHEYRENSEDAVADGMILALRYGIKPIQAIDAEPVCDAKINTDK